MASLNEISYRILNIIRPKLSDDDAIDISEIKFDVNNIRSTLLKRKFNKKYFEIPSNLVQTLDNLSVSYVNSSTVFSPEIAANTVLLKSNLKLPKILQSNMGKSIIKEVSAANILSDNFTVINGRFAKSSGSGKFNKRNAFVFIEDDYLYIITKRLIYKALEYVNIQAVFEDGNAIKDFKNANYSTDTSDTMYDANLLYTDDDEYPVTLDMIKEIEDIIVYNKLLTENNAAIDSNNDGSDSIREVNLDGR